MTDHSFPYILFKLRSIMLLLILASVVTACSDESFRPGVIASVNGQDIMLSEVEARRIAVFSGQSAQANFFSDAVLQKQYRYIVGQMIEELLVYQYMAKEKLLPSDDDLNKEEAALLADYPEGAFEETLLEEGVELQLWKQIQQRRMVMLRFLAQVLRPQLSISKEEVQQFYLNNKDMFVIPEHLHFLQFTGPVKKDVAQAIEQYKQSKDAESLQKEFLVTVHDVSMAAEMLPEDVQNALKKLSPGQSSSITSRDKEYHGFVLLEKIAPSTMDAATISRRVEAILAEEKMRVSYANWLQQQLVAANIRIAPALVDALKCDIDDLLPGKSTPFVDISVTEDDAGQPDGDQPDDDEEDAGSDNGE